MMSSDSTCPICYEDLHDKFKASPDNCDHIFCLPCLERWAKSGCYCPVDRKRFKKILDLQTNSLIQVKTHRRKRKRTVYDFTSHCEVCSGTTDSNVMLLCDCCDLGYHIHCLKPPLKKVPSGLWCCPTCIAVEEKLKKKNGITKEVEAEMGGFDNNLLCKDKIKEKVIKESESKVKAIKADNTTPITKNTNVLQACYDIINKFEDMDVKKNCKDGCSSSYSDFTINKIDKIYKTFNSASKSSTGECSKNLKYSVTKTYQKTKKIKSFATGKSPKSCSEIDRLNVADKSLKNMSYNINLHNHTIASNNYPESFNNFTFFDDINLFSKDESGKEHNPSLHSDQISLYSETEDIMCDKIFENSLQGKNYDPAVQIFEDLNASKSENVLENEKNVKETFPRKSFETCLNKKAEGYMKKEKFSRATIASYAENSKPSSSCDRNKSSTGTSKNLIQFSVFQRIEGIDASQEICSQISSIDVPFSLNILSQNCSTCNDKCIARSEIQCKVCKLKYFKVKESKRFSNCVRHFKKELGFEKHENINLNKMRFDIEMLGTEKLLINRHAIALERRKRSLIHKLKKIHDSKCINITSVN